MTTPAETTASEVESLRATVVALDAEIARLKAICANLAGAATYGAGGIIEDLMDRETKAEARALRYRARLARLCHAMSTIWIPTWVTSNTYGQVWSRTAHRPTPERSETP